VAQVVSGRPQKNGAMSHLSKRTSMSFESPENFFRAFFASSISRYQDVQETPHRSMGTILLPLSFLKDVLALINPRSIMLSWAQRVNLNLK